MALLLLDASSVVNLLGITTRFGNASIETTTRNALIVRDLFNIQAQSSKERENPWAYVWVRAILSMCTGKTGLGTFPYRRPTHSLRRNQQRKRWWISHGLPDKK